MTIYISSLVIILLCAISAVWLIHRSFQQTNALLVADNLDLRSRLFISKGFPPAGVNVTEQYIEKKEEQKQQSETGKPRRKTQGPLERVVKGWTEKDRKLAEKLN